MPETLNRLVDELADEVRALRGEIHRRTRWVWATIAAMVLVGALAVVGAYVLIERNNVKFCGLIAISAKPDPPAATARGRDAQREAARLADRFGCP